MTPKALIVDDSLTVRMDLHECLSSAGFTTVLSADLEQARRAIEENELALVLLDLLLPDGDGLDLLRELKGDPRTARIPVLLLSTEAEVKSRVRGVAAGADEYLGKPYDTAQVVARARALTGERFLRPETGPRPRVLLIDDSATFRAELRQALDGAGFEVSEAVTGEEGVAVAAAARPDAIVVDGILPGIDGTTVIRRIKSDTSLRATPCLLLTAAETTEHELRALEAGADSYVRKSDDLGEILARLQALLRGSSARTGASESEIRRPFFRQAV